MSLNGVTSPRSRNSAGELHTISAPTTSGLQAEISQIILAHYLMIEQA